MKATSTLKGALLLCIVFFSLTSCKKSNDDDTPGIAKLSLVNSSQNSWPQNFYIDGSLLNSKAIAYTQFTPYFDVPSNGSHSGEFRIMRDNSLTLKLDVSFEKNKYYSLFFAGDPIAPFRLLVEDDMTAPEAGKAKVRFVHLSSALTSSVDIGLRNSTDKMLTGLQYKNASRYYNVNAGTAFKLYSSGSSTVALNIASDLVVDKIYTIFLCGSTIDSINYIIIQQN